MALLGNLAGYARVPYGTLGSERVNFPGKTLKKKLHA